MAAFGISAALLLQRPVYQAAVAQERRKTLKEAANLAADIGNFELSDTEGALNLRVSRSRIAFEIQMELLQKLRK